MNTVDCIFNRHSYRGKYAEGVVPTKEELRLIMEAGMAAPSACNRQTTSFIAVDDKERVDRIKAVIDPPIAQVAPAFICVLTQRIIAYRGRCYSIQDYSAAIQNMLLTIVDLGYQSCWYEGHITDEDRICDKIAAILDVPDGYDVVCILPVGKAIEEVKPPRKKESKDRAWFNKFGG